MARLEPGTLLLQDESVTIKPLEETSHSLIFHLFDNKWKARITMAIND